MVTREFPPEAQFFDKPRPSAGPETVSITLGSLTISLSGLDAQLADELFSRYEPYSSRSTRRK